MRKVIAAEIASRKVQRGKTVEGVATDIAKRLGVKVERVRSAFRRRLARPEKQHGNQLLTDDEELALAALADAKSMLHEPFAKADFLSFVKEAFPELADRKLSQWYKSFVARHKDINPASCGKGSHSSPCFTGDLTLRREVG
jgi:hypothetical protein